MASDPIEKYVEDSPVGLEPKVISKANPKGQDLLQARADIQRRRDIRDLFQKSMEEGWEEGRLLDRVASELASIWPEGEDPSEAVEYLIDEYNQLGDGIYLVSRETGKTLAILNSEDIYQPEVVPREGGGMVSPLKRIRPDLEAGIHLWIHDRDREAKALDRLAARGYQTDLVKKEGDPRLLVATRAGRKHIVNSMRHFDPKDLLSSLGGTSATFLRHFVLVSEAPENADRLCHVKGHVESSSSMNVQDPLTFNLHHNRAATLLQSLVQGWVRKIAEAVANEAHRGHTAPIPFRDIAKGTWIAPPEHWKSLRGRAEMVPVEDVKPTLVLDGLAGYLRIPSEFQVKSGEMFDRWLTKTSLDFEFWIDLTRLQPYDFSNMPVDPQVVSE